MSLVEQHKEQFNKTIEHLKTEIASLRTGRATPALVEDIPVEAYGTKQQLKAVASISVLDAKSIAVDPWDKNLMSSIEEAIRNSQLGFNPVNDGKLIRISLPDLTAERRMELIKVLQQKLENARIAIRKIREEVRSKINKAEKDKEIREDEKFKMQEELDKLVKEFNDKVKQVGEEKEREINTV